MTHEFRIAKSWRIIIYVCISLFMLLFICLGLLPFIEKDSASGAWYFIPVSITLLAFCVWGLIDCIKGKLVITDDSVIQVSAFKTKELPFSMVKGFTSDDKYLTILAAETGFPNIRVSTYTERMEELKEVLTWHTTDLDQQRFEQEEEQILSNEELGASEAERAEKLEAARKLARYLNVAGIISLLWLLLFPRPYNLAVAAALLLPLVVLYALYRYKGLMKIGEKAKSAYPNVFGALLMPSLGLMLRALLDFHLLHYNRIGTAVIILTLILTSTFLFSSRSHSQGEEKKLPKALYLLFFIAAYSFGGCVIGNCLLDDSNPSHYTAAIVDKRISSGKHNTYYLKLEQWGPVNGEDEVSVPRGLYDRINQGEVVNIYLMQGALHVPWFVVTE